MGLNESTQSGSVFVNIVNGSFARRVTPETPGAKKRVIEKKDGSKKEVHELYYRDLTGNITDATIDSTDFGDQLKIFVDDLGEKFIVSMSLSSREAKSFMCCLKNINMDDAVTLFPFNFEGDDKRVIGLNVYQGATSSGERIDKSLKVQPYFSRETPNGLPQVPDGADTDEFKLVMKQQEIFLKKWIKSGEWKEKKVVEKKVADKSVKQEQDDLPF